MDLDTPIAILDVRDLLVGCLLLCLYLLWRLARLLRLPDDRPGPPAPPLQPLAEEDVVFRARSRRPSLGAGAGAGALTALHQLLGMAERPRPLAHGTYRAPAMCRICGRPNDEAHVPH
jgi:hypothetical protein